MKFLRKRQPATAAVEAAASLWVVRCERGLTAAEQDEFLQWLAAAPAHGQEYARLQRNWRRLRLLADCRPPHSLRPNRDLLAPPATSALQWCRDRRWLVPFALATAAAIAWGVFRAPEVHPVPGGSRPRSSIAAIEQRNLPDGTRIDLNRGAAIAVLYSAAERRVTLERGEAHFDVAKDPRRPFIVTASGVDVRAVGTAFNVRLDSAAIEVLVTEGQIEVAPEPIGGRRTADFSSATEGARLQAGQRAVMPLGKTSSSPEISEVSTAEIERRLAWQPRELEFRDTPLSAIVAEFNHRNAPIEIVIADSGLASTEVTASLRSDNIEGFVRLLEAGFSVEVERSAQAVILRRAGGR
jgi:transmembrane sensor